MANVKQFPKALYKGNSVNKTFSVEESDGTTHEFEVGDKVRLGIKLNLDETDYVVYKEFTITAPGTEMALILTPEETENIPTEVEAILEIEYVYNNGASIKTVYQDKINLEGVVINE